MLCLEELYLFSQFSENEKEEKIANGILSSIINKLILLFDEELSFIEIDKYLIVRKYLELFETYFLKSFSSRLAEYTNPEIEVQNKTILNKNYTIGNYYIYFGDNSHQIIKLKNIEVNNGNFIKKCIGENTPIVFNS